MEQKHEAHLSTQCHQAQANPWFPGAYGNQEWSESNQPPASQRSSSPFRLNSFLPDLDFPTSCRLLSKPDFDRVFNNRTASARARGLLALYVENQSGTARLGMTVARKNMGSAVRRNRIRRQLRDAFRRARPDLPNCDIVVIVRKDIKSISEDQWYGLCQQLFQRIIASHRNGTSLSG